MTEPSTPSPRAGSSAVALSVGVAVELAHALIQRQCDELGLRLLFLSGPAAQHQGLRKRHLSSDVDALLPPEDARQLESSLAAAGWFPRPFGMEGVALKHPLTLIHDQWPIDIDVHHLIPGAAAPPDAVFDLLWARREHTDLAHWRVNVPGRTDHALVLILNILRSSPETETDPRLAYTGQALTDDEMQSLDRRITEFDCGPHVTPLVRRYGRGLIHLDTREPDRTWLLHQHLDQPALLWMDGVARAPRTPKPMLLLSAVLPSRRVLSERDLTLIAAPRRQLFAERVGRLARAAVHFPALLRTYREIRRSSRARGE